MWVYVFPPVALTGGHQSARPSGLIHPAQETLLDGSCRGAQPFLSGPSYNLMTPAHKLLSGLQQNLMSELKKRETPRSRIGPNRSIASPALPRHTSVWTGSMKQGVLIRAGGAVCFSSCSCFRHHYHSSHHQAVWLLSRCEAQQTWLNLAVCILQRATSCAITES